MRSKFDKAVNFFENGNLNESKKLCLEIIKDEPKNFDILHLLGIIAFQTKSYETSVNFIKKAIKINPNNPELYKNIAVAYNELDQLDNALNSCETAIKLNSNYAEAYNHKGHILVRLNEYELGIETWKKVLEIKPEYPEVLNNLGNAYTKLKKFDNALNYYNKSIQLKPDFPDAYINRTFVLSELEKYDSALEDCNKAIKLKANFAEAYNNKAIIFRKLKKLESSYKNYSKAYELKPDINFLFGSLIYTKLNLGIWDNFEKNLKKLEEKIIKNLNPIHPYSSLILCESPKLQKLSSENFFKSNYPIKSNKKTDINNKYKPKKKIRIGYYSGDFCTHPVSSLIVNLLELHDKSKFEVFGFYFGKDKKDEMLTRISKTFNHFYYVRSKTDKEISELSKSINIDIAIDLMTYTEGNRFGIFIEKCAPIQINYLGFPGTSGSDCIDYIIADKVLIPKENEKYYSEKIIFLPDSYQANDNKKYISNKTFTKKELNLPENIFVYCCFNKNQKINPNVFNIWTEILKNVNNSVLWLLEENITFVKNIKKEFKKKNIDPNRIIFAKKIVDLGVFLSRNKLANLFLDTMPYGAHKTFNDALWSGLPVITKIGQTFASRVGASLLNAVDLPELITETDEDYKNLAIELGLNPEKISKIKLKLENNKLNKPLFNTKLFTKNIESAYTEIYKKNVSNLPITNIELKNY